MDTSKQYVEMCSKAKEIQDLQPVIKDTWDDEDYRYTSFYYFPNEHDTENGGSIRIFKWDNDECHPIIGDYHDNAEGCIWLPRQDQLQNMIEGNLNHLILSFQDFYMENCVFDQKFDADKISMEQLWLAFVMKEKYSKIWNGTDWIEIK